MFGHTTLKTNHYIFSILLLYYAHISDQSFKSYNDFLINRVLLQPTKNVCSVPLCNDATFIESKRINSQTVTSHYSGSCRFTGFCWRALSVLTVRRMCFVAPSGGRLKNKTWFILGKHFPDFFGKVECCQYGGISMWTKAVTARRIALIHFHTVCRRKNAKKHVILYTALCELMCVLCIIHLKIMKFMALHKHHPFSCRIILRCTFTNIISGLFTTFLQLVGTSTSINSRKFSLVSLSCRSRSDFYNLAVKVNNSILFFFLMK